MRLTVPNFARTCHLQAGGEPPPRRASTTSPVSLSTCYFQLLTTSCLLPHVFLRRCCELFI